MLDSSAAINFKRHLSGEDQRRFWPLLLAFVERGELTFPQQVWREVGDVEKPDDLARWAQNARDTIGSLPAPDDSTVAGLLREHRALARSTSSREPADAYVVALALEMRSEGYRVHVVADDRAIQQACNANGIATETAREFVAQVFRGRA